MRSRYPAARQSPARRRLREGPAAAASGIRDSAQGRLAPDLLFNQWRRWRYRVRLVRARRLSRQHRLPERKAAQASPQPPAHPWSWPRGPLALAGLTNAAATTLQAGTASGARGAGGTASLSAVATTTATPADALGNGGGVTAAGTASTAALPTVALGRGGTVTTAQVTAQTAVPGGGLAGGRLVQLTAAAAVVSLVAGAGGLSGAVSASGTSTIPSGTPGGTRAAGSLAQTFLVVLAFASRVFGGPGTQTFSTEFVPLHIRGAMTGVGRAIFGMTGVDRATADMTPSDRTLATMSGVNSG
jgi:hypothetical protein